MLLAFAGLRHASIWDAASTQKQPVQGTKVCNHIPQALVMR
jgi:hypothetical protein